MQKIFNILLVSIVASFISTSGTVALTSSQQARASISSSCLTITHEGTANNCSSYIKHSIINQDIHDHVVYHYNSSIAKKGQRSVDINANNYYRPLCCGAAIVNSKGDVTDEAAIYLPW